MVSDTQQIPVGYKQTDVGVIPEDWEVSKLGDICSYINDGTHHTPTYVDAGIPFYSVENVTNNDFKNTKFISPTEHGRLIKRCKPEKGDILLTRIGTLGLTKLINWDVNASIYVSLALLKLKRKTLPEYIYAYSKSEQFVNEILKRSLVNATPQKINMGEIEGVPVCMPGSVKEQSIIAEVFSDIDSLISKLNQLIQKKKNIKQGAMQELLTGKRRLPGFIEVWEETTLESVVDIRKGELITSNTIKQGNVPVIAGGKTPAYFHNKANRFGKTITISASGASAGYVGIHPLPIFASDCSTIEESSSYSISFIYYWMKLMQEEIYYLQTGGAQPHIHPSDLNPMPISIPGIEEQIAIEQVLLDMDTDIDNLEDEKLKYKKLKQGMMQQLLTGKIRLI